MTVWIVGMVSSAISDSGTVWWLVVASGKTSEEKGLEVLEQRLKVKASTWHTVSTLETKTFTVSLKELIQRRQVSGDRKLASAMEESPCSGSDPNPTLKPVYVLRPRHKIRSYSVTRGPAFSKGTQSAIQHNFCLDYFRVYIAASFRTKLNLPKIRNFKTVFSTKNIV